MNFKLTMRPNFVHCAKNSHTQHHFAHYAKVQRVSVNFFFKPSQALTPPFSPQFASTLSLRISLPPCDLFIVSLRASVPSTILSHPHPPSPHLTSPSISHSKSPLSRAHHPFISRGPFLYFHIAWTQGALAAPSPSRTPRQRASSARVPHDSPSQAMKAP